MIRRLQSHLLPALLYLLASSGHLIAEDSLSLEYRVDWRLWHAGDIRLTYFPPDPTHPADRQAELTLKTRGFVDSVYQVNNRYTVQFGDRYCADSYEFHVREGKKRRHITTDYQNPPGKARYIERDLTKDREAARKTVSVPVCVHDELTALARLRATPMKVGETIEIPVSNGKKSIQAKVVALKRETVKTPAGEFEAVRYEIFLFNNVLYRKSGRLFLWLTDDERRLPVQFRVRLRFYYGTITLRLVKEETT